MWVGKVGGRFISVCFPVWKNKIKMFQIETNINFLNTVVFCYLSKFIVVLNSTVYYGQLTTGCGLNTSPPSPHHSPLYHNTQITGLFFNIENYKMFFSRNVLLKAVIFIDVPKLEVASLRGLEIIFASLFFIRVSSGRRFCCFLLPVRVVYQRQQSRQGQQAGRAINWQLECRGLCVTGHKEPPTPNHPPNLQPSSWQRHVCATLHTRCLIDPYCLNGPLMSLSRTPGDLGWFQP